MVTEAVSGSHVIVDRKGSFRGVSSIEAFSLGGGCRALAEFLFSLPNARNVETVGTQVICVPDILCWCSSAHVSTVGDCVFRAHRPACLFTKKPPAYLRLATIRANNEIRLGRLS